MEKVTRSLGGEVTFFFYRINTLFTMKRLLTTLFAALCLLSATAQTATEKRIIQLAKSDNQTMHHLDVLVNRIGGRPTGSAAGESAERWAADCFRRWGLEVSLEPVGEMRLGFNRGGWWGHMTGEESRSLHFATPSYSVGTRGPVRGHVVIEPRTQAQFDRNKGRMKGAWVLVNGISAGWTLPRGEKAAERRRAIIEANNEAERHNRALRGREGERKAIDEQTPALFYDEMVEAGVLGFVQAAKVPIRALYDTTAVRGGLSFEELPSTPTILLDEEQYRRIHTLASQRRDVTLEFDIRNHFRPGPIPYHNVVARIEGAKRPDEYVIVGAHLDSYDVATGGVDCGSGVSVVMEAARLLVESGAKPDRTILFILYAGEEFGLWGSSAWVKQHADLLPKISNLFNRDGGPMPYTGFSVPASLVKHYERLAEPLRELYPDYGFRIDTLRTRKVPTQTGGTDASSFAVKGVPAVQMNEWNDPKGYGFEYGEIWHTERDTYQKSIPEYQEQASVAMALMLLGTANLDTMWPREEVYE